MSCTSEFLEKKNKRTVFYASASEKQIVEAKCTTYPRELHSFNFTPLDVANSFHAVYKDDFRMIKLRVDFFLALKLGQLNSFSRQLAWTLCLKVKILHVLTCYFHVQQLL